MKHLNFFFLLLFCSTISYGQSDEQGILATVNDYLDGGTNGNVSQFKNAFVSDAIQRSIGRNGTVIGMSVESLSSKITPGKTMSRETSILSWSYAGIAGTAITETVYPSSKIIDLLNLLKINGEWKIVSRVYSRIDSNEELTSSGQSIAKPATPKTKTAPKKKVETVVDDGW